MIIGIIKLKVINTLGRYPRSYKPYHPMALILTKKTIIPVNTLVAIILRGACKSLVKRFLKEHAFFL